MAETADLVKGLNRRIVTAEVDVRDYAALKAAVDSGVEQLGRLDIIVANAGIGNGGETLAKTSEDDWNDMIDINLSGVWKTVKAGVPHLIAGGSGGSIILTSSVGGAQGLSSLRALRRRQARRGGADAHLRSGVGSAHDSGQLGAPDPREHADDQQRRHVPDVPAGPGEPGGRRHGADLPDVPHAAHSVGGRHRRQQRVLFFASDEGRYLTGVTLPIDAGSCLK
jgi:(+)-trans-carveol dehydrogenase